MNLYSGTDLFLSGRGVNKENCEGLDTAHYLVLIDFKGQFEVQESILEKVEQFFELYYNYILRLRRGARVDEGGGLESR
jgi:hypothetical protein